MESLECGYLFNTFSASTEAKRQAFLEKPSGLGYLLTGAVKYPMNIDLSLGINNYYRWLKILGCKSAYTGALIP